MKRLVYPTSKTSYSPRSAAAIMARNSGVVVAGGSSMESGPDQPDFATFQLSPVSTRPSSAMARPCMAIWAVGPYLSS